MQRSKQQALMFLLGALLVGGVLGFSANRVIAAKKPARIPARIQMYDDIGIDSALRVKMDSVLDETNCRTGDILRAVRPSMDSVRAEGLRTFLDMMTPAQRAAYSAREKRVKARMDSLEKVSEAKWAKDHPGEQRRRCRANRNGASGQGNAGRPGAAPATPERRPGGPLFY